MLFKIDEAELSEEQGKAAEAGHCSGECVQTASRVSPQTQKCFRDHLRHQRRQGDHPRSTSEQGQYTPTYLHILCDM